MSYNAIRHTNVEELHLSRQTQFCIHEQAGMIMGHNYLALLNLTNRPRAKSQAGRQCPHDTNARLACRHSNVRFSRGEAA